MEVCAAVPDQFSFRPSKLSKPYIISLSKNEDRVLILFPWKTPSSINKSPGECIFLASLIPNWSPLFFLKNNELAKYFKSLVECSKLSS